MTSQGLDYFLLDTDFFENDKIELIEGEFKEQGGYLAIRLLCKIYKSKGYYYAWGEDECLLLAKKLSDAYTPEFVDAVVHCMVRRGFFSQPLFEQYGILTSEELQRRYFEAVRKRKEVIVKKEYLLVDGAKYKNVAFFEENGGILPEKGGISKQSKVKESKVNTSSLSSSSGRSGGIKPESMEEQEKIVHFFTFKRNWAAPNKEYKRLVAYNNEPGKPGWASLTPEQRETYTESWAPLSKESRFKEDFLRCWEKVYSELIRLDAPIEIRLEALADSLRVYKRGGTIHLCCSEGLREFIEQPEVIEAVKPILWPYVKANECIGIVYPKES